MINHPYIDKALNEHLSNCREEFIRMKMFVRGMNQTQTIRLNTEC